MDPLHSNPRGNLLPEPRPVSEFAISDPFYQPTARIRYEDPSLRDSSAFSVLALLRFFLHRFLPLLCLMILSIAHRQVFFVLLYIFLFFFSFYHDTSVLVLRSCIIRDKFFELLCVEITALGKLNIVHCICMYSRSFV